MPRPNTAAHAGEKWVPCGGEVGFFLRWVANPTNAVEWVEELCGSRRLDGTLSEFNPHPRAASNVRVFYVFA